MEKKELCFFCNNELCNCVIGEADPDIINKVSPDDWTYCLTPQHYYDYENELNRTLREQDQLRKKYCDMASDSLAREFLLTNIKQLAGEKVFQDDRVQELDIDKMSPKILQMLYTLLSRIKDEKLIVITPKREFIVDKEIEKMREQLMEDEND